MPIAMIPQDIVVQDVARALAEDLGAGDLTADLLPADQAGRATIISREPATLAGRAWVDEVFRQVDPRVELLWQVADGEAVAPGQLLCRLRGPVRSLFTGERTALNFLQTLSGTATAAQRYAAAVAGTHTRILDTRKTLPGLRQAQKYAVRCGGGCNHRMGLYDAILIKENHIYAAGSIAAALGRAQALHPGVRTEIEVEGLDELRDALAAGAKLVLLDNFSLPMLRVAVALNAGRAELEASGNMDLAGVRQVAETGVDFISVGAITKHLAAVDLSMRFEL